MTVFITTGAVAPKVKMNGKRTSIKGVGPNGVIFKR